MCSLWGEEIQTDKLVINFKFICFFLNSRYIQHLHEEENETK